MLPVESRWLSGIFSIHENRNGTRESSAVSNQFGWAQSAYFTEQPYGRVLATATAFPDIASCSASDT